MTITYILVIALLALQAHTSKINCQWEQGPWQPGKSFPISDREEIVSTRYDLDMVVDRLDGLVSTVIKNQGTWQAHNLRTFVRFVQEGSTVLNIGSHVGLEAVVMGKIIGSKGRLFIMEPYSVTYNILLKNIYLNGLGDIATVFNVGASNKYSKGYIQVTTQNTGASEIFTDQTISKPKVKTEEVVVDRVDNILPKDAVVDFALIDVQFLEVECLEGMKENILRSPNIVIMCEWSGTSNNSRDIKKKIKDLIDWFVNLKFKFYRDWQKPPNCSPHKFTQITPQYVVSMPDPADQGFIPDIYIVPDHIDPNNVF